MARSAANEPKRLAVTSKGAKIPAESNQSDYLSEHHPLGVNEKCAGDYAEDLTAQMLTTTLGAKFDPNTDWNEREEVFKMSGKIVRTSNMTQTAEGDRNGLWTTDFFATYSSRLIKTKPSLSRKKP